jgi:Tfp pilus assembly protein PilN
MLKPLVNKIIAPFSNTYAIAVYQNNLQFSFQLIEFSYLRNELIVVQKFTSIQFEDILKKLTKNYPVILHLEGDNIVSKVVDDKPNYEQELIFKSNKDDFYFYEYQQTSKIYLSVIRKTEAEVFVNKIGNQNRLVVNLTLGPYALIHLGLIHKQKTEFSSPFNKLIIHKNLVLDISTNTSDNTTLFKIQDEEYSTFELPLLASFLDYKFTASKLKNETLLKHNTEEQKYKTYTFFFGSLSLVIIVLLLMVGHFVLQYQHETLLKKKEAHLVAQRNYEHINKLKEELAIKEKMFHSSGLSNHQYFTKYIVEIGNLLNETSNLTLIEVFPVKKRIDPNEKVHYQINEIAVYGEVQNDGDFNDWLSKLKLQNWIRKVEIKNYDYESGDSKKFELNIKL